jgi:hypothetical protein
MGTGAFLRERRQWTPTELLPRVQCANLRPCNKYSAEIIATSGVREIEREFLFNRDFQCLGFSLSTISWVSRKPGKTSER